jgi:tripartite-type tricarboxylate transporter receptor subunit TctC
VTALGTSFQNNPLGETMSMRILRALCLLTAMLGAPLAHAETAAYPTRPVKLVVAWSPGGATDILARVVAVELGKQLGQTLVIENRPGANGTIGQTQVATSAPDGYTLILATNSTYAIADHLYKSLPYKLDRDFAPISLLAASPLIMAVRPSLEVKGRQRPDRDGAQAAGQAELCLRRQWLDQPSGR